MIADLDTGNGNALNVIRFVQEFEPADCAGGQLRDQIVYDRWPACVPEGYLIDVANMKRVNKILERGGAVARREAEKAAALAAAR